MAKTCYIDLDETLIFCRDYGLEKPINAVYFRYLDDKQDSWVSLRPSAIPFLEALKARGYSLRVMTQSNLTFKKACLAALNLLPYFDDFHGYNNPPTDWTVNKPSPQDLKQPWVLIDNLHPKDRNIWDKRFWLGEVELEKGINFLQCSSFNGYYGFENNDEPPLTTLISKIEKILG